MANPTEDDLRVADEVLMNTMLSTSVHFMLRSRIVSAIATEREKAARIIEGYARHAPTVCQQAAASIRSGDKQ